MRVQTYPESHNYQDANVQEKTTIYHGRKLKRFLMITNFLRVNKPLVVKQ